MKTVLSYDKHTGVQIAKVINMTPKLVISQFLNNKTLRVMLISKES